MMDFGLKWTTPGMPSPIYRISSRYVMLFQSTPPHQEIPLSWVSNARQSRSGFRSR